MSDGVCDSNNVINIKYNVKRYSQLSYFCMGNLTLNRFFPVLFSILISKIENGLKVIHLLDLRNSAQLKKVQLVHVLNTFFKVINVNN